MENRVVYGHPEAQIRESCLTPFSAEWTQPTTDEVRWVLKLAGLTGSEASIFVGVTNSRTIRRWTGGDTPIPYAIWALLCEKAGLGMIWK